MLCLLKLLIVSNEHSLVLFVKIFIEKIIANDVRYASGLSIPSGYIYKYRTFTMSLDKTVML